MCVYLDFLKSIIQLLLGKSQPVSITADETADVRDHGILNIMASVIGKPYLIAVIHMEVCKHCTFSRAIIQSVTHVGI